MAYGYRHTNTTDEYGIVNRGVAIERSIPIDTSDPAIVMQSADGSPPPGYQAVLDNGVTNTRWNGSSIVALTAQELATIEAAEDAAEKANAIAAAKALLAASQADQDRLVRALALVLLDEVNLIRSAIVTLHPAASGSLPQRTAQQLKAAIENKIDTSSDSL